jgi:hypothetical protein
MGNTFSSLEEEPLKEEREREKNNDHPPEPKTKHRRRRRGNTIRHRRKLPPIENDPYEINN